MGSLGELGKMLRCRFSFSEIQPFYDEVIQSNFCMGANRLVYFFMNEPAKKRKFPPIYRVIFLRVILKDEICVRDDVLRVKQ